MILNQYKWIVVSLALISSCSSYEDKLIGKWESPENDVTIEFLKDGTVCESTHNHYDNNALNISTVGTYKIIDKQKVRLDFPGKGKIYNISFYNDALIVVDELNDKYIFKKYPYDPINKKIIGLWIYNKNDNNFYMQIKFDKTIVDRFQTFDPKRRYGNTWDARVKSKYKIINDNTLTMTWWEKDGEEEYFLNISESGNTLKLSGKKGLEYLFYRYVK